MKLNWIFPGGGGRGRCKTNNLPLGEYGYFLELHILVLDINERRGVMEFSISTLY